MRSEPVPRTVTGRFSAAGSPLSGSGFVVSKLGTGSWIVRFTPPFRALLAMTASAEGGAAAPNTPTAESCGIYCNLLSTGAAADSVIHFTATGLPR